MRGDGSATPSRGRFPLSAAEAALSADQRTGVAREPWLPGTLEGAAEPVESEHAGEGERKGGASDAFRSGASDAFRR